MQFGCTLEFITNKSQEGSQFCRGFGGIGGILRYSVDPTLNEVSLQFRRSCMLRRALLVTVARHGLTMPGLRISRWGGHTLACRAQQILLCWHAAVQGHCRANVAQDVSAVLNLQTDCGPRRVQVDSDMDGVEWDSDSGAAPGTARPRCRVLV